MKKRVENVEISNLALSSLLPGSTMLENIMNSRKKYKKRYQMYVNEKRDIFQPRFACHLFGFSSLNRL